MATLMELMRERAGGGPIAPDGGTLQDRERSTRVSREWEDLRIWVRTLDPSLLKGTEEEEDGCRR